jgi:hypothetical protein
VALGKLKVDKLKTEEGKVLIGRRSMNLVAQPYLVTPLLQFLTVVARSNA